MMLPPSKTFLQPPATNPATVEVVDISEEGDIVKVRNSTDIFHILLWPYEYAQNEDLFFPGIIYMHSILSW